jgi:hypothetical protein
MGQAVTALGRDLIIGVYALKRRDGIASGAATRHGNAGFKTPFALPPISGRDADVADDAADPGRPEKGFSTPRVGDWRKTAVPGPGLSC